MFENIDFSAIDVTAPPPGREPERQYYFIAKAKKLLSVKSSEIGRPLTAMVKTFGCQMNERDSEKLRGILETVGYQPTDSEEADFVLYNTCTVRENANLKVYGRLGYLGGLKKKNPHMVIAMCGCMMQEAEVVDKIQKSYRFVNLIFGTHNIYKFAELLVSALENDRMIIDIWKDTDKIVEDLPAKRTYSFKSGVNIMFGCNNFCSYCIVPYVRGRERSRRPIDIIREIEGLVADGVVEVMLLGQNVNSYGKNPKICHHLHLPLQSGSSRLLKIMNRKYDKEKYLEVAEKLRREIPDLSLTTDIIVGFPGETEEDFQETLDVVRRVRYDSAFTFIYSKRTGTPAAVMENQVPEEIIKDRFERLLALVQEIGREMSSRLQGKTLPVLVEHVNEQDDALVTGRLENNLVVHFPGDSSMIGKTVDVYLKECHGFYYIGEPAEYN